MYNSSIRSWFWSFVDSAWTRTFGRNYLLTVPHWLSVKVSVCKLEGGCQYAREDDFDYVTQRYLLNNDIRLWVKGTLLATPLRPLLFEFLTCFPTCLWVLRLMHHHPQAFTIWIYYALFNDKHVMKQGMIWHIIMFSTLGEKRPTS